MIRRTLNSTKSATFAILLPNVNEHGAPTPIGTGFFVSPNGFFVTAAHVITKDNRSDGQIRDDISQGWLMKEPGDGDWGELLCQYVEFVDIDPITDIALLHVDFNANSNKTWLKDKSEFPFIKISTRVLDEGEPVYAFGYPLPEHVYFNTENFSFAGTILSPRTTSAIIASTLEKLEMVSSPDDPKRYVLDKALNYGNSGGPIVSTETGNVFAICSKFQPVFIPQPHLPVRDINGNMFRIMIPSLYGVVSSLANENIVNILRNNNVPITNL